MAFKTDMTVARLVSLLSRPEHRDHHGLIDELRDYPLTLSVFMSDFAHGVFNQLPEDIPLPCRNVRAEGDRAYPFNEHGIDTIEDPAVLWTDSVFTVAPLHCEVAVVWPSSLWSRPTIDVLVAFPGRAKADLQLWEQQRHLFDP